MSQTEAVKAWFSRRRLGLFMHFGLYAIEGWHEQDQMRRRIPRAEYQQLIHKFNPHSFNPDAILDLAESVGMTYVCLTTKHHDGFCLWDTAQTDYNIMQTPYGRDLLKEFADACHARNFPLGLYYSIADWHHPNYPNQGRHHELAAPEADDEPDWDKYMDFVKAQVRELCTNYGEVRHFFWDINVPEHVDESVNAMLRDLQPKIVINNRGFDKGDFGTPEREYNQSETDRARSFESPTEACNSVGTQSWGYRKDEDYYTGSFLQHSIGTFMAKGANYLLNVGPDADGNLPPQAVAVLQEVGDWYKRVRDAFSDSRPASHLTNNRQVLLTRRDKTLYVHVQGLLRSDAILLPPITTLPQKATLLNTKENLSSHIDRLPVYWKRNDTVLCIRGLNSKKLKPGEPVVLELEFEDLPESIDTNVEAFKG